MEHRAGELPLELDRPSGTPALMLGAIDEMEALTRRLSALFDTRGEEVPDLRGVLGGQEVGDVGDFRAAALRVYEQQTYRTEKDVHALDFVEFEVRRAVIDVGKLLLAANNEIDRLTVELNDYLRRDAVDGWNSSPDSVLGRFQTHTAAMELVENNALRLVAEKARDIEEWIDTVRTLGPVPGSGRQLAARAERMNEIMKDLSVTNEHGRLTIRGGPKGVIAQILKRGDLQFGTIHDDPALVRWLAANMSFLRSHGVRAMMVEALQTDEQSILEEFEATGDIGRLKEELRKVTDYGEGFVDAHAQLYAAARGEGIRLVAMDNSFRHWNENLSDRIRVANPFWVARYQQLRSDLSEDERIAVLGGAGHSRSVSGFEGYVPGIYSVDQYQPVSRPGQAPPLHASINIQLGEVVVHPAPPVSTPISADEDAATIVRNDNSDFIFHAAPESLGDRPPGR